MVDRVDWLLIPIFVDEDHGILKRDRLHVAGKLLPHDVARASLFGGFLGTAGHREPSHTRQDGKEEQHRAEPLRGSEHRAIGSECHRCFSEGVFDP